MAEELQKKAYIRYNPTTGAPEIDVLPATNVPQGMAELTNIDQIRAGARKQQDYYKGLIARYGEGDPYTQTLKSNAGFYGGQDINSLGLQQLIGGAGLSNFDEVNKILSGQKIASGVTKLTPEEATAQGFNPQNNVNGFYSNEALASQAQQKQDLATGKVVANPNGAGVVPTGSAATGNIQQIDKQQQTQATLPVGLQGNQTAQVQQTLKNAGFNIAVDGIMGPKTRAAIKEWQARNGLVADGIAGTNTLTKMGLMRTGDTSGGTTGGTAAGTGGTGAPTGTPTGTTVGTSDTTNISSGTPGFKTTEELLTSAMKELGISDTKAQRDKFYKDQQVLTDEMNQKIADVNNNPWYSAGKRDMETRKIQASYESKLNTLSNFAKLYEAQYDSDMATAKFLATGMQEDQQFAMNLALKKQEAIDALSKLESGIVGEYQFAVKQGYKGSFTQYQNEDANRKAAIAKAGATQLPTTQDLGTKETSEALGAVNSIGNILSNPSFNTAFGVEGIVRSNLPGTPEYTLAAQIQQIKDKLSLAARGALKGQGQISNFEGLMLQNAQTSLRTGMKPADARQELINIQGALMTSTGGEARVQLRDKSGATQTRMLNSRDITRAINDGLSVRYTQ